MSVKQVTQIICDRCEKLVESTEDKAAAPVASTIPKVYAEGSLLDDALKIHFTDLCAKCVVRVQALLSQIRLDDNSKDDAKGGDGKPNVSDNPPAAQKPKTPTKDAVTASAKP